MKLFKLLIKIILVIVLVVGVLVGVVIYQISDNSFSEPEYLKSLEPIKLDGNQMVSKGIEDSETSNAISLTFSEKEMNILLKTLSENMNKNLENSNIDIETMYIDIDNGHDIKFISYFDFNGFKTSLKGDFNLELKDEIFTMTIEDFKVGKMNFERDTVVSILNKYVDQSKLKTNLNVAGINVIANLSTFTISFDLMDLKDLISYTEEDDEDLYHTLIDIFFRIENLITLSDKEESMGIKIDLTSFGYNELSDSKMPYELNLDDVNLKLEKLLNDKVIEIEDANMISTYLVKGYRHSTEEVKNKIINYNLTSIGIEDNTKYVGIIPYLNESIEELFGSQIPSMEVPFSSEINEFDGLKLTENGWNDFFAKSEAVGQVYSFIREENEVYKSSYIAIESMYIDIKNNHFALYLIVSINGKRIPFNFEMDSKTTDGLRISSSVDSMRIGSDSLLDDEIVKLLNFLNKSISDEWIIIDEINKKMDFDFALLFSGSQDLSEFMQCFNNVHTSFVEKDNEGYTLIDAELDLNIDLDINI